METSANTKNPVLAAVLSALLNGAGQIYNGQIGKALGIIGIQIVNGLLTFVIIGWLTFPIVYVWSIYDAYTEAKKLSEQRLIQDTKPCPRCAERVQRTAQVCRYCGHEFEPVRTPSIAE